MKFILYLSKRIIILFFAFIIPTSIAFASYKIIKLGIQPYNIGIRSLFNLAINQLPIIIFTSYTLAIIFSIVLTDKTKINNLISLHLPPIIITIIMLSIFFFLGLKGNAEKFFITSNNKIKVGINTFFKRGVFNSIENKIVYFNYNNNKLIAFIYDKSKNSLIPIKKISFNKGRLLMYTIYKKPSLIKIKINHDNSSEKISFFKNRLIKNYTSGLENLTKNVKKIYYNLNTQDKIIFLSSFILSFIIFIVPLSFLINDGGWSITGLIGVVLILIILPILYNFIFIMEFKYKSIFSFLGKYNYLICSIGFFALGFLIDIFIKLFHKAEV